MAVTVSPDVFELVAFDAGAIASVAREVAASLGLPDDLPIEIEVDEGSILTRGLLERVEPVVHIRAAGGAFEDKSRPRTYSEEATRIELTRLLTRVADRRTPAFSDAPDESALTPEQEVAWDAYALGRAAAAGDVAIHQPRHRYDFELRLGFGPEADARFDRLWSASGLTWTDVAAAAVPVSAAS
jgi:hypothetical protein